MGLVGAVLIARWSASLLKTRLSRRLTGVATLSHLTIEVEPRA
jgi:hypothetical protein